MLVKKPQRKRTSKPNAIGAKEKSHNSASNQNRTRERKIPGSTRRQVENANRDPKVVSRDNTRHQGGSRFEILGSNLEDDRIPNEDIADMEEDTSIIQSWQTRKEILLMIMW